MHIRSADFLRRAPIDDDPELLSRVQAIVAEVRQHGDSALRTLTARFDKVTLDDFHYPVPDEASARALVSADVWGALTLAADRLTSFHRQQPAVSWFTQQLGGLVGQRVSPLRRVACYAPGGTAPLPSTVLHTALIARVAGVREIVLVTPPNPAYAASGYIHPAILAAAHLAGVTEIVRLGGAQAIAALAFGTASVRRADKIVGPGNIYVTLAKKLVYGAVGIDGLAGPTETVVIADEHANPAWVAADLLAQAEHDVLAAAILLTPSAPLAHAVQAEVARRLEGLPRADFITATFEKNSGIVLTRDLAEACALASDYAPEHLCLAVRDPWHWASHVPNAGGLFMGEHAFEVLGDYVAGPSHVMPTGGSARFASPLNVWDFVRLTSLIAVDEATTQHIAPAARTLAQTEMLQAHAAAAAERAPGDPR